MFDHFSFCIRPNKFPHQQDDATTATTQHAIFVIAKTATIIQPKGSATPRAIDTALGNAGPELYGQHENRPNFEPASNAGVQHASTNGEYGKVAAAPPQIRRNG